MAKEFSFHVAFDDADPGGIVFFGNFFKLAHRGFEQYLPAIGIAWQEWFNTPGRGVPLRHAQADYRQPLRPGRPFSVRCQVKKVGDSSAQFEFQLLNEESQLCCVVETVHVFIDTRDRRKLSIPENIRRCLEAELQA